MAKGQHGFLQRGLSGVKDKLFQVVHGCLKFVDLWETFFGEIQRGLAGRLGRVSAGSCDTASKSHIAIDP